MNWRLSNLFILKLTVRITILNVQTILSTSRCRWLTWNVLKPRLSTKQTRFWFYLAALIQGLIDSGLGDFSLRFHRFWDRFESSNHVALVSQHFCWILKSNFCFKISDLIMHLTMSQIYVFLSAMGKFSSLLRLLIRALRSLMTPFEEWSSWLQTIAYQYVVMQTSAPNSQEMQL